MTVTSTYNEARTILAHLNEQRKRVAPNSRGPIVSRLLTFDTDTKFKVAVGIDRNQWGLIDVVAIARSSLPPEGERTALVCRSDGGMVMHLSTRYEDMVGFANLFLRERQNPEDVLDLIGNRDDLTIEKLRAAHPNDPAIAMALTFRKDVRPAPIAG